MPRSGQNKYNAHELGPVSDPDSVEFDEPNSGSGSRQDKKDSAFPLAFRCAY